MQRHVGDYPFERRNAAEEAMPDAPTYVVGACAHRHSLRTPPAAQPLSCSDRTDRNKRRSDSKRSSLCDSYHEKIELGRILIDNDQRDFPLLATIEHAAEYTVCIP
ncbi:hypothetical protein [Lysobacter enzymogenes]|uniref:hypothetical protein n=1 Tax=Lysobacter enzymogenes TaxID=69 RepID=UPI00202806C7|nr:hypothetical protein [Lysobacter enzymogenes]